MKTRLLMIIGIFVVVTVLVIAYGLITLEFESGSKPLLCGKNFIQRGNECFPDISYLDQNTILIYSIHSPNQIRTIPLPSTSVIFLEKNNTVTWINESNFPATVYEKENKWVIDSIEPKMQKQITFNHTGFYEYFVKNSDDRGHGRLALVSDDTDLLPHHTKLEIARAIVKQDRVNYPIIGLGIGNAENSLGIDVDKKYLEENPDAYSFLMKRYAKMIPFDVKITIEFSGPIMPTAG